MQASDHSAGATRDAEGFAKAFEAYWTVPTVDGLDALLGERDGVLIEFRLIGTLGGRSIEWPVVDRFVLREGLAVERVSYYDPTRLLLAILTRPRSWLRFLRSGLGSGRTMRP
jgi:hypothetical protein